jgi:hypothetical protein
MISIIQGRVPDKSGWGGRLVIEGPDVEQRPVRMIALAEKLILMRSHFHAPQAVQGMLEAAGGRVRLEREGGKFWAVVEAEADQEGRAAGGPQRLGLYSPHARGWTASRVRRICFAGAASWWYTRLAADCGACLTSIDRDLQMNGNEGS